MSVTDITQIYNNVPMLWAAPRLTTAYLWHGARSRHLEVLLKPHVSSSHSKVHTYPMLTSWDNTCPFQHC